MQEVGYAGGEDEGMWGSMGGVGVSNGEGGGGGGGASTTTTPNPPPPKPSRNPTPADPPSRSESFPSSRPTRVMTGRSPGPKSPTPLPPTTTARPMKAASAPKPTNPPKAATANPPPPPPPPTTNTDIPKGAEKKDAGPEDPIVGTVVHVPYPTGVERGTVRGIHGRKYGAVWVEYLGGTTLYKVARPLLFPTPEEAKRYPDEARAGKENLKPPTPTNDETNPPNLNPTTQPTNPTTPPPDPRRCGTPLRSPMRYKGPHGDAMGHNGHAQHISTHT